MKILTVILALSMSSVVMANGFQLNISGQTSVGTYGASYTSTGPLYVHKMILNDTQEAMQSGKISAFLAEQIKEVQALDSELSVNEAIEILAISATEALN